MMRAKLLGLCAAQHPKDWESPKGEGDCPRTLKGDESRAPLSGPLELTLRKARGTDALVEDFL